MIWIYDELREMKEKRFEANWASHVNKHSSQCLWIFKHKPIGKLIEWSLRGTRPRIVICIQGFSLEWCLRNRNSIQMTPETLWTKRFFAKKASPLIPPRNLFVFQHLIATWSNLKSPLSVEPDANREFSVMMELVWFIGGYLLVRTVVADKRRNFKFEIREAHFTWNNVRKVMILGRCVPASLKIWKNNSWIVFAKRKNG